MSDTASTLRQILADVLGLAPERAAALTDSSGLFGHLPELDSMAVAGLLAEIEDRFGLMLDLDDIDADMLADFGALRRFIDDARAR